MKKITLITPPDIFENDSLSLLFMNVTEQEQDLASEWLGKAETDREINIYYYQGETNPEWLLFAVNRVEGVYINADTESDISKWLMSFLLSKNNTWYKTDNANLKALFSFINQKNVPDITKFLEAHLGKA